MQHVSGLRRLPFAGPDGKPSYVPEGGSGVISALADAVEATALDDAREVMAYARRMLANTGANRPELRFTARRLLEALTATVTVAECRGERLPAAPGGRAPGCR
jgi:hypothetical protein